MSIKAALVSESDFTMHAPIQLVSHPFLKEHQIDLWVQRDDLIHPFISGNKWRKLKYVVRDLLRKNRKHLVTFGGPWSNHLLATACAGANFGFKTTAFVRGEPVRNPVLAMAKMFGMELIFTDRTSFRNPEQLFEAFQSTHSTTEIAEMYFLPQGGQHKLALQGCAEIIENLSFDPDKIFCACGTGTTLAGLTVGIERHYGVKQEAEKIPELIGIPVIGQGELLDADIKSLNPSGKFTLLNEYHFGGYARTKPELIEFITDFCKNTGILIEPVYTGKLFYGIFDQIKQNKIQRGEKILAIHTGGITGLLGMYEKWM